MFIDEFNADGILFFMERDQVESRLDVLEVTYEKTDELGFADLLVDEYQIWEFDVVFDPTFIADYEYSYLLMCALVTIW